MRKLTVQYFNFIIPFLIFINLACATSQEMTKCKSQMNAMEYFKDQNNKREWIMRSNYFEIPNVWSNHGTFDHIALPKKLFPRGDQFKLEIFISGPAGKTHLSTLKFISHENYFKSSGKSFSPKIHKYREKSEKIIFKLKDTNGIVKCEFSLPYQKDDH